MRGLPLTVTLAPRVVTSVARFGLPDTHPSYGTGKLRDTPVWFLHHTSCGKSLRSSDRFFCTVPRSIHRLCTASHTPTGLVVHRLSQGLSTVAFVAAPPVSLSFLRSPPRGGTVIRLRIIDSGGRGGWG